MTFCIITKATSQPPRGETFSSQCISAHTNKTWETSGTFNIVQGIVRDVSSILTGIFQWSLSHYTVFRVMCNFR